MKLTIEYQDYYVFKDERSVHLLHYALRNVDTVS